MDQMDQDFEFMQCAEYEFYSRVQGQRVNNGESNESGAIFCLGNDHGSTLHVAETFSNTRQNKSTSDILGVDDDVYRSIDLKALCLNTSDQSGVIVERPYSSQIEALPSIERSDGYDHCTPQFQSGKVLERQNPVLIRNDILPPPMPLSPSNELFTVDISLPALIDAISSFIFKFNSKFSICYSPFEFTWHGKFIFPYAPCNFAIRLYRCGSSESVKFAVEMQLVEGDRFSYYDLYCAVRERVIGPGQGPQVFSMELDIADEDDQLGDASSVEDLELFQGPHSIKAVLLDALRDDSAGFASKMEAYRIANSLISSKASDAEEYAEIFDAMHALSADTHTPQYAWLTNFLPETYPQAISVN